MKSKPIVVYVKRDTIDDFMPEERNAAKRLLELSSGIYGFDHYGQVNQPITSLRIYSRQPWTAEDFEALTELRHVRELEIGNIPLSKRAMEILAAFPELEYLKVEEGRPLNKELFEPFAGHGKLKMLYTGSAQGDERCFEIVATWPNFEDLQVPYFPFTNATCRAFAKNAKILTKFWHFSVGKTAIDDQGFAALAALPSLAILGLHESPIRGHGATAYLDHPSIYSMHLQNNKIDDDGLAAFAGIKNLNHSISRTTPSPMLASPNSPSSGESRSSIGYHSPKQKSRERVWTSCHCLRS